MKRIYSTSLLTRILHLILWLGLFYIFFWIHEQFIPHKTAFFKSASLILLFSFIFYTHSLFLINNFLEKRKYTLYTLFTVLLFFSSVFIRFRLDKIFPNTQLPFQSFMTTHRPFAAPFLMVFFWLAFSMLYQLLINRFTSERKYLSQLNEFSLAQNEFLKNQINPHFLFNNLNNIYSLVQTGSPHAPEMILKLSDLLRYSLYKTSGNKISLREELTQLRNLISLYQLKENNSMDIKIDETAVIKDVNIEPMLLIPILENCFKHGNILVNEDAYIRISVVSNEDHFLYRVENSVSTGVKAATNEGGIGLKNIQKRLHLIYGEKASLEINDQKKTFKAELKILWT